MAKAAHARNTAKNFMVNNSMSYKKKQCELFSKKKKNNNLLQRQKLIFCAFCYMN
jgi:hypothetical protein